MRIHLINATLIDGSGREPVPDCSVVIEDHRIVEISSRPVVPYDTSDVVLDAHRGFVLPGLVNHHAHGLTRGPLMIVGEPPLSDARVLFNCDRNLRGGVTTALNVDGFPTVEDARSTMKRHPMNIAVSTLHTPLHLQWVDSPFPFGGVKAHHKLSAESMVQRGALAVGETGPGIDGHWADYTLIPAAVEAVTGVRLTKEAAQLLRAAAEARAEDSVRHLLDSHFSADNRIHSEWPEIFERVQAWRELARAACDEAVETGIRLGVPVIFHHTPATFALIADAAASAGDRIIAAHSNYLATSPGDACRRARELRRRGALIDVMSGDTYGPAQFFPNNDVQFAMFGEGLVDLISSDYAGGFWDPLLRVVAEANRAGVLALGEGVRMVTSRPAEAIPGLAPERGLLKPGAVADIVITAPDRLEDVRSVLISGHPVAVRSENPLIAPGTPVLSHCC